MWWCAVLGVSRARDVNHWMYTCPAERRMRMPVAGTGIEGLDPAPIAAFGRRNLGGFGWFALLVFLRLRHVAPRQELS